MTSGAKKPHELYSSTLPKDGIYSFHETSPYWLKQELEYYSGYNLGHFGVLRRRFGHLPEVQEFVEKNFNLQAGIYEKSHDTLDEIERLMREKKLSLYRYDARVGGENEFGLILLDQYGNLVQKIEGWIP